MNEQILFDEQGFYEKFLHPLEGFVEWDRCIVLSKVSALAFGWIARPDGFYDFIEVWGARHPKARAWEAIHVLTSSSRFDAEIEKAIGMHLGKVDKTKCESVFRRFPQARLVRWQKNIKELEDKQASEQLNK